MELTKQVTSLELSKKLKELGVKQESLFWWHGKEEWVNKKSKTISGDICTVKILDAKLHWSIGRCRNESPDCKENYHAYTVAELGELLPRSCRTQKSMKEEWHCHKESCVSLYGNTEANARAKMIIYLLEINLMII